MLQIIKKDYSSNPWRLVDSEGREIEAPGMDIVTNERGAKWAIKKNIWGQTNSFTGTDIGELVSMEGKNEN